jgi:hypothetical protein
MSLAALWLLIFGVAAVAILVAIAIALTSAIRLGVHLARRLGAYGQLPILARAAHASDDVARIEAALDALPMLGSSRYRGADGRRLLL